MGLGLPTLGAPGCRGRGWHGTRPATLGAKCREEELAWECTCCMLAILSISPTLPDMPDVEEGQKR